MFRCDVNCRLFVDALYQAEEVPFCSQFGESFIGDGCFASMEVITWFFIFEYVNTVNYIELF